LTIHQLFSHGRLANDNIIVPLFAWSRPGFSGLAATPMIIYTAGPWGAGPHPEFVRGLKKLMTKTRRANLLTKKASLHYS